MMAVATHATEAVTQFVQSFRSANQWRQALRMSQNCHEPVCRTGLQLSTPVLVESSSAGDPAAEVRHARQDLAPDHRR